MPASNIHIITNSVCMNIHSIYLLFFVYWGAANRERHTVCECRRLRLTCFTFSECAAGISVSLSIPCLPSPRLVSAPSGSLDSLPSSQTATLRTDTHWYSPFNTVFQLHFLPQLQSLHAASCLLWSHAVPIIDSGRDKSYPLTLVPLSSPPITPLSHQINCCKSFSVLLSLSHSFGLKCCRWPPCYHRFSHFPRAHRPAFTFLPFFFPLMRWAHFFKSVCFLRRRCHCVHGNFQNCWKWHQFWNAVWGCPWSASYFLSNAPPLLVAGGKNPKKTKPAS